MKLKKRIQKIFCKDVLVRVKHLEENVINITAEKDDLSEKLAAAELAYNMLLSEYDNYRKRYMEKRTSPKWCPLAVVVALGEAAKVGTISSEALAKVSVALSERVSTNE